MAGPHLPVDPSTRARHALALAVATIALGVLIAGTVARAVGGTITLVGWALGVYALHTYGRLGRVRNEPAPADVSAAKEDDAP